MWSDLHLSDPGPLAAFGRPFADVAVMNRHLLAESRHLVGPDDTIICLNDVAHPDAWRDPRLKLHLPRCLRHRFLIRGNHGTARVWLWTAGFEGQSDFALYAVDPPLALSHEPLEALPVSAVNLPGTFARAPSRPGGTSIWPSSSGNTGRPDGARRRGGPPALGGSQQQAPFRAG